MSGQDIWISYTSRGLRGVSGIHKPLGDWKGAFSAHKPLEDGEGDWGARGTIGTEVVAYGAQ